MAITKTKVLKQITIKETGYIEIQWANRIKEDDVILAETYERTTKHIKSDLSDMEDKIKELSKLKNLYPDESVIGGGQ